MTPRPLLLALLFTACTAPRPGEPAPEIDGGSTDGGGVVDAGPALRVLFVGNSYTSVNNLPEVVRALGEATPGAHVEVEKVTVGGARLADHWATTGARERIAGGAFDAVVLQGQSMETVSSPADFDLHAGLFAGALAEVGARGVWFATWARRNVEANPEVLVELIEQRYRAAAEHNGDVVARVGVAWEIALLEEPEVSLFAADRSHPAAAGTLLAACVIHQALTGVTPRVPDPPPLGVPADVARALCAIAEGGVRCNAGESLCDGSCVAWDVTNCGGCGIACNPSDPCTRGVCGCPAGLVGCSERCTNIETNPEHCGGCGQTCSPGAVCTSGQCACPNSSRRYLPDVDLAAFDPSCDPDPFSMNGYATCRTATHRYCASLDCFASGFGPPSGHAPPELLCLEGEVRTTTYSELQALAPDCDGVTGPANQSCTSAIHRWCVAAGAASGFGPVEVAGDTLTVTCLPNATLVQTTLSELVGFASRCNPDPITCSVASWNFCYYEQGQRIGYGPVEVAGDDAVVVCVD